MLAVVLALAAAIGYGGSDFAAGLATRAASVIQVTLLATVASFVVTAAALPFAAGHPPTAASLAWGAAAGLGSTLGAFALYLGFRYAPFSVAAPLSAVGTAGFSVLAGLLLGERPSGLALAGIVLALPAIVAVSAGAASDNPGLVPVPGPAAALAEVHPGPRAPAPDPGAAAPGAVDSAGPGTTHSAGRPAAGVVAGLVAGLCFALLLVGLNRAGSGSGLWPVASAQVAELVLAVAAAAVTRNMRLPGGWPGWQSAIAGATGAAGAIVYFYATHDGFLAVIAVLTSLYPASTIVLARTVLGERLTRLRLAGLGLAAVCVALIAAGGAGLPGGGITPPRSEATRRPVAAGRSRPGRW
ncbi:MAG: EamA family transporter [Streptosporangiaceae bacterium]